MYSVVSLRDVKLQRRLGRKYQGKEYVKWIVVIPPKQVRELQWGEGETLEGVVKGQALILRRPSRL